jgi:MscS family membrane protein
MNDFFEQVWLDNKIRDYLIVLAVILFVVILKRIISRYFAGLIFRIVKRAWKRIEKKSFINLVVQPLGIFFVVLTAIVSLYRLHFPKDLEFEIYHFTLKHLINAIGSIIFIAVFTWLLLRMIDFIAMILEQKADLTPEQTDNQLIVFFKDFFKVIIAIIGLMLILKYAFNLNISSLITGLSIVGAAIALSLRESIENLIASFIIFFDKPFTTGDLVKVVNITGTVEKIGLRSTRIRSDQKTFVAVPNKQMVDTVLDNLSLRTQRKVELKLEINLKTSSAKIEKLIEGLKKIVQIESIEDSNVYMSNISGQFYLIQSDYFNGPVTIKEFNSIKQEVNLKALKLMEELQIEIAGANADVRINNTSINSGQQ